MATTDVRSGQAKVAASPGHWAIPAMTLATGASWLGSGALAPLLPAIAANLGVGVSLLGQVPALTLLLASVLALVAGPLADATSHRRLLELALASVVVSTVAMAFAPNLPLLLLAALIGALGRSATQPVTQAIATTRLQDDAQRRAVSWLAVGTASGPVVGVPLVTTAAALVSWQAGFLLIAALTAASLLLVRATLPLDARLPAAPLRLTGILAAYRPLLHHRTSLALIGQTTLTATGFWATTTYAGALFVDRYGATTQEVGLVFLALGIGFGVGSFALRGRLGCLPQRPLMTVSLAAMGLLMATALLLPAPPLVAVACLTVATVMNGVNNVAITLLLAGASPTGRATTLTARGAALSLGIGLGSALGGLLLALGGYPALGLGAAAACLGALALVWLGRPTVSCNS